MIHDTLLYCAFKIIIQLDFIIAKHNKINIYTCIWDTSLL